MVKESIWVRSRGDKTGYKICTQTVNTGENWPLHHSESETLTTEMGSRYRITDAKKISSKL